MTNFKKTYCSMTFHLDSRWEDSEQAVSHNAVTRQRWNGVHSAILIRIWTWTNFLPLKTVRKVDSDVTCKCMYVFVNFSVSFSCHISSFKNDIGRSQAYQLLCTRVGNSKMRNCEESNSSSSCFFHLHCPSALHHWSLVTFPLKRRGYHGSMAHGRPYILVSVTACRRRL